MATELTSTNVSFNFLKTSSDFLNIIMNNINSCILLLDKDMRLRAFNDSLKTIFSNKQDEDLLYQRCGEAIGCAYQLEEKTECGQTTRCIGCDLRIAGLKSYMDNEVICKDHIVRPFFNKFNRKVDKHLQFSTRLFVYRREKYIIMIIEDITKFYESAKTNKALTRSRRAGEVVAARDKPSA
jgi:hypothetical protein